MSSPRRSFQMKELGPFYNLAKFYSYWVTSLETVGDSFWPSMAPKKAKFRKRPQNPRRGAGDGTLKKILIEQTIHSKKPIANRQNKSINGP